MNNIKKIMTYSVGTMVLTLVHHAYGAVIYDEPFRLHVAFFAVPVIIFILLSYAGYIKSDSPLLKKISLVVFLVLSIIFSVCAIGIYEGGYNHLVKNVFYFGGVSQSVLDNMYPSVTEMPNDVIFELTGIGQFITGVLCLVHLLKSYGRTYLV